MDEYEIYCITRISNNRKYYGKRKRLIAGQQDIGINYFGSSSVLNNNPELNPWEHPGDYTYEVLYVTDSKEEQDRLEEQVIRSAKDRNEAIYNISVSPIGGNLIENDRTDGLWYTDGIHNITIFPNDPIPDGYHHGLTYHYSGYLDDSHWYNNGKYEYRVLKGEQPADGYTKGRLPNTVSFPDTTGWRYITNGRDQTLIPPDVDINTRPGWWYGKADYANRGGFNDGMISETNGTENHWILPDQPLDPGFWYGRTQKSSDHNTGTKWYNNGLESSNPNYAQGMYIPGTEPDGWILGTKLCGGSNTTGKHRANNGVETHFYEYNPDDPNEGLPAGYHWNSEDWK